MYWIKNNLVNNISIISINPYDPVLVENIPEEWSLIGRGNFAAVFTHPSLVGKVVKVYAENRKGIEEEISVYRQLREHASFSNLEDYGDRYLVLKKLVGITLYQAFKAGIYVPQTVIADVDNAISYAKSQGLNPTDIHGKNIIMNGGRGYIVDVSDFLKPYSCPKWNHFKKVYYYFYFPLFKKIHLSLPYWFLERIRKGYQSYLLLSGYRKKQESYNRK